MIIYSYEGNLLFIIVKECGQKGKSAFKIKLTFGQKIAVLVKKG